jgi:hypothetical protein
MKPLLWIAVALALLTLSACKRETSWNQRLTIVVETPTGEVNGSSVTRVVNTETSGSLVLPEARGVRNAVTGEAVVIEVAPGRYLFALLGGSDDQYRDASHWVYPAYNLGDAGSYSAAMSIVQAQPYDTPVPLPPEGWPLMVTFTDIADPTSVASVDPADLAASFGEGVRLKAVTLEITRAEVTTGRLKKILSWWLEMRAGPYNEMIQLQLPDSSPRGWDDLSPLQFWSLDQVLAFTRRP